MLVWKAMPSITPMMSAIFFELSLIWSIVETTSAMTWPPRWATSAAEAASWLAWRAESDDWFTVPVSCIIDEAACCSCDAVSSVRTLRSWLPVAISALAVLMLSLDECTWATVERMACTMRPRPSTRLPAAAAGTRTPSSPRASAAITPIATRGSPPIWRSTLRATSRPSTPIKASAAREMPAWRSAVARTSASTPSMYRPEPTIQFHPGIFTRYCSFG